MIDYDKTLENKARGITQPDRQIAFSQAVSLKRIADALEKMNEPMIVKEVRVDGRRPDGYDAETVRKIVAEMGGHNRSQGR